MHFQNRIETIYDHLYANAKIRTPSAICTEVRKILHVAMFLEEVKKRAPAFTFTKGEAKSLLNHDSLLTRWLCQELGKNFAEMNDLWKLYAPNAGLQLGPSDLAFTCVQLNGVFISDRQTDVLGEALELFRSAWAKRTGGQFFTDQRVTRLAMTLLQFDPRKGDDLVDICAGSGGFLLAGLNHMRELVESEAASGPIDARVAALALASLHGQEIDRDVCDVANASLCARLGMVGTAFVSQGDSLQVQAFTAKDRGGLRFGKHACAASNPPFGSKSTVKDTSSLRQFDLATSSNQTDGRIDTHQIHPRSPDILFLEQNLRMLRPGSGRLAIVLPYQLLSGPQTLYVRRWLLRQAELLAVVDLPVETFQPYTGTKTALVLARRRLVALRGLTPPAGHRVFMAIPRWIGHDRRGAPVYRTTPDGRLSERVLCDFPEVELAFRAFLSGKDPREVYDRSFSVREGDVFNDRLLRVNALFHQPPEKSGTVRGRAKASDWQVRRLGDVVARIFYPGRFKRHYVDWAPGAVPFLGGADICQLIVASDKWLSPEDPKLGELRVEAGWLLITRSGSTGIVSSVPQAWDGVAMSEHVIRIVPDPERLPAEYLEAFLKTTYARRELARGVFGSVIDEISPQFVAALEIFVPKSKRTLGDIVARVRSAEVSRQQALEGLYGAVNLLDQLLKA